MPLGPQFVRFFPYVLDALRQLGNSGTPSEVYDIVAHNAQLSEDELKQQIRQGSRFENQVAWARFYLSKAGYIDSSKRGVWSLNELGIKTHLSEKDSLAVFNSVQKKVREKMPTGVPETQETSVSLDEQPAPIGSEFSGQDYRAELLNVLRNLPPAGFEQMCQRLLRESGFQQVEVTGRTGDGGIDGRGLLQVNPFVSIQVVFQCKRYNADNTVGSPEIQKFRGAMSGRTDNGIFITTSSFSPAAKQEATRAGTVIIELVDGEKLVTMFEKLELGLKPKRTYELDQEFFEEFN